LPLYVLKGNALENDRYRVSPIFQIFRLKGTDGSRSRTASARRY